MRFMLGYKNFWDKYRRIILLIYAALSLSLFFIPYTFAKVQSEFISSSFYSFFVSSIRFLTQHEWNAINKWYFSVFAILNTLSIIIACAGCLITALSKKYSPWKVMFFLLPMLAVQIYNVIKTNSMLYNDIKYTFHIGFYLLLLMIILPILYLISTKLNYDNLPPPKPRKPTKAERIAQLEAEVDRLKT